MQTNVDTTKKLTIINNIVLLFFSTPVFISMTLLYILWGTAVYGDNDFLKPPGYGSVWGDPKYHMYYAPLSPYIDNCWGLAVLSFPIILVYYVVLLIRKKRINKILFIIILFFYTLLIGNIIFCRLGGHSNPFSAWYWYLD